MRATEAPRCGFTVATSIRTDVRQPALYGDRAGQASEAGRILSSVPGTDEGLRRPTGAGQAHGGGLGRPRGRRRGLGGHGPPFARHGRNGHGPRPDRGLRRDLARDDGGDDVALRDPGGPRVRADGRRAKGMAGRHWRACRSCIPSGRTWMSVGWWRNGPRRPAQYHKRPPSCTRFSGAPSRPHYPVEHLTRHELLINIETARALGVTIPSCAAPASGSGDLVKMDRITCPAAR